MIIIGYEELVSMVCAGYDCYLSMVDMEVV